MKRWYFSRRYPFIWPKDETDLRLIHFNAMMRRGEPAHIAPPPESYFCEHFRVYGTAEVRGATCGVCGRMAPDWSVNA